MNDLKCALALLFLLVVTTGVGAQDRKKSKDADRYKADLDTEYQVPKEFVVTKTKVTLVGPGPRDSVPIVVWVGDALIEFSVKLKFKGVWKGKHQDKTHKGSVGLVVDIEEVCSVSRLLTRAKKSGVKVKELDSDNIHKMVRDLTSGDLKKFDSYMIRKKINLPANFPMDWVSVDFGELDFPSSGREKDEATLYRFVVRENEKLKGFSQQPAYFVTGKRPVFVRNANLARSIVSGFSSAGLIDPSTKSFLMKSIKDWQNYNSRQVK